MPKPIIAIHLLFCFFMRHLGHQNCLEWGEIANMEIIVWLGLVDDTWAWVAIGPERQPDAATGAPAVAKDAPAADEGILEEEVHGLRRDVRSLRGLVEISMTDQGRLSTWMMACMAQLMDASGLTYQVFDGTFRGSSHASFHRCNRKRTGEASTSAT
ncbi:hypothetical protein Tco_1140223 [Tanacetum coccineum]